MIKVHHLNNSHSHVVLWLLEELGVDYEIVRHQRDPQTGRSPPSLRAAHPAAKAPTIEDHGQVMIESGGILLYLLEAYGNGRLRPAPNTAAAMRFYQWLTFIEGSAKAPLMNSFFMSRMAPDDTARNGMAAEMAKIPLRLIEDELQSRAFIAGDAFTAADIQLGFMEELLDGTGQLTAWPGMGAHLERMRARDGYKQAEAKGGPVDIGGLFKSLGA
jgi:glutathione S-transferase